VGSTGLEAPRNKIYVGIYRGIYCNGTYVLCICTCMPHSDAEDGQIHFLTKLSMLIGTAWTLGIPQVATLWLDPVFGRLQ
jgi:hypothetical protein